MGAGIGSPFRLTATTVYVTVSPTSTALPGRGGHLQGDDGVVAGGELAAAGQRHHDEPRPREPHPGPPSDRPLGVLERRLGVLDPSVGVGPLGRPGQEGAEVLRRQSRVAPLEEQERDAVVRADQRRVELDGAAIVADRLVGLARLGERDGHVLQDPGVLRVVAQRQPVGGERRLEIPLPLERERLVQVIEALRTQRGGLSLAEQPTPEAHTVDGSLTRGEKGLKSWYSRKIAPILEGRNVVARPGARG